MHTFFQPSRIKQGLRRGRDRTEQIAAAYCFLRTGGRLDGNTGRLAQPLAERLQFFAIATEHLDALQRHGGTDCANMPLGLPAGTEHTGHRRVGTGQPFGGHAAGGTGTNHAKIIRFDHRPQTTARRIEQMQQETIAAPV